jgi:hypothetical protein
MATDDYGQNITLMSLSDAPSIPKAIADLAAGVVPRGVMRFASASTRGATLAGLFAPVEGMMSWLIAEKRLDVYDGTAWRQIPYFPSGPAISHQVSMPGSFTTGSFEDFSSGNWAPVVTTIPASGRDLLSRSSITSVSICTVSPWNRGRGNRTSSHPRLAIAVPSVVSPTEIPVISPSVKHEFTSRCPYCVSVRQYSSSR